MEITADIRREEGSYWAEVPALPGCFASGHDLDELFDSLREGVELYLEDSQGKNVSRPERPLQLTSAVLSTTASA
ncbi:MAG TPA: type II toxin-antitoxin system HicB family antitoxin [Solirubrobacterales bacterium]|nr:type II toxin-antitoxin system HicB family antitoxin [Solirubrobacterales bacterium]